MNTDDQIGRLLTNAKEAGRSRCGAGTALWVALGSGIGGVARVAVAGIALRFLGDAFPYGILAVNVLGSFAIGLIAAMTSTGGRLELSDRKRQFVMAGICGGFTTYSFFMLGTLVLWREGNLSEAILYVMATLIGSMAAVWWGHWLGVRIGR